MVLFLAFAAERLNRSLADAVSHDILKISPLVPFAFLLACGSTSEPPSDCVLETALSGGAAQQVTEDSPTICGAGSGPTTIEMGFALSDSSPVPRFIFQMPGLDTAAVGSATPAHLRLLRSTTDFDGPGWIADECLAVIDDVRVVDDAQAFTIAYVTAHGTCDALATPEPGNPIPAIVVEPFRFTGIAGWNK